MSRRVEPENSGTADPTPAGARPAAVTPESAAAFINRELSWLGFADRVLALVSDPEVPLLERVKFAGIVGMLHDEFFMKRVSGLKRRVDRGSRGTSVDGLTAQDELEACAKELLRQTRVLEQGIEHDLRPMLAREGQAILDHEQLAPQQRLALREHFRRTIEPILTPLAADAEHPFPFISGLGLNLAVLIPDASAEGGQRFVRIKVPDNRSRWVGLLDGTGFVPLEQVIAANLDLLLPDTPSAATHLFRVTRGAEGERNPADELADDDQLKEPGSLILLVAHELKARKFAGAVRLEVDQAMPEPLIDWLCRQVGVARRDVYVMRQFLGLRDLVGLEITAGERLSYPRHRPAVHARLRDVGPEPAAVFEEIARGDILLHHPYHCFESSVLRFLEAAAADPQVLALKLTIYRTGVDSPIIRALIDASRRGKQVAVLVEITARFDEAPNIAWGKLLEREGVHVAYGVERLKTHVKLALVVREEAGEIRRYAHLGTGNYNVNTARLYEDLGLLTSDPQICNDVASVFNSLTGATPRNALARLIVAPQFMRQRFLEMIRREAEHAAGGRPSGIWAKFNQLQDQEVIRALYGASQAGVPITLVIRGVCCLRPGVVGLSETIRVQGLVGRFLEHSRIYRFANGGNPEYYIGSADWMKRNLDARVETVVPLDDPSVRRQIDRLIEIYEMDNASVWDCAVDGTYVRRRPDPGRPRVAAQERFAQEAAGMP